MMGKHFWIQENGVGDIKVVGKHPEEEDELIPCSRPFCDVQVDSMRELLEHERVAHPEIWEEDEGGEYRGR